MPGSDRFDSSPPQGLRPASLHDDVHVARGRQLGIDALEECQKLLVPPMTLPDDSQVAIFSAANSDVVRGARSHEVGPGITPMNRHILRHSHADSRDRVLHIPPAFRPPASRQVPLLEALPNKLNAGRPPALHCSHRSRTGLSSSADSLGCLT